MTESKQDAILRRVRGLIAKAQSTEFEGEREVFMKKADELMEQYAIETWMLQQDDASKARLVVRKNMDMSWWTQLGNLHWDAKSEIWWLFSACVTHCRCYTTWNVFSYSEKTIAVYGQESDLTYLDLLFTDLFTQLFAKIRPQYNPSQSMGQNVMRAKEAGMKYTDIAVWLGHPEWRVPNGTGGYKTADNGKMLREYKSYLKSIGKTTKDVITVHPDTYAINFLQAFRVEISRRFREMRDESEKRNDNSMALALRDMRQVAQEALWEDFPDLRPHPADCPCQVCVAARKPVKYREGRQWNAAAQVAGASAGATARIASKGDRGLRQNKQLN